MSIDTPAPHKLTSKPDEDLGMYGEFTEARARGRAEAWLKANRQKHRQVDSMHQPIRRFTERHGRIVEITEP